MSPAIHDPQVLAALLEGMRRAEACRARGLNFGAGLRDELGGSYGTLEDARAVAGRLLSAPGVIERLGHAGIVALGEAVCLAWNRLGHDPERMRAWFRQPREDCGGRSPYDCVQAGDVAALLALLRR